LADEDLIAPSRPALADPPAGEATVADCPRLDGLPVRMLDGGLRVAEAATRKSRMKGLAKLDALPETLALHIPKCKSVHTVTMRFPLDLIWLDKHGRVVRVDHDIPPLRLKSCLRAASVVEAGAGTGDAFLAAGLAVAE
jgi:uncharacterized membrane protein (UPF0127 family)